ncbi:reverse transcriptase [Tanacetum coccineum]
MMATRNGKVFWSFDSLEKFSSMSFGKEMENSSYSDPVIHLVWKFKGPPKAHLLCWQSIVGKLPTRYALLIIDIIRQNQSRCPLCNSCTESVDHLIIHYKFALSIWFALISCWDCNWVIPRNTRTLVSWWMDMAKVKKCKEVWQTTFFSVVWHIWDARNKEIFTGNISSYWLVLDLVKFNNGVLPWMVNENLDLSASRIIVESDSLNAVSWVRHPLERPWRLLSHFQEIHLFLSTNDNRSISHIKREGNCEADKLAKEGVLRSVPLSIWNL